LVLRSQGSLKID